MRGKTFSKTLADRESVEISFANGGTIAFVTWTTGMFIITSPGGDKMDATGISVWNTNFDKFIISNETGAPFTFKINIGDGQFLN